MAYNLGGETVIVTGVASGIGKKTAERFAQADANVVVADVVADGVERRRRDRIRRGHSDVHRDRRECPVDVEAMVQTAVETYGSVDIAVNNAGIEGENVPLTELAVDDWNRVIDISLKGVWLCMKHELQEMVENGGGAIVNTSSIAGLVAAGGPPYVASKHGVLGLTKVAATQYAQDDVRVNAVRPGVIDTEMVQRAAEDDPDSIEQFVQMQPLGRMGTPEEIANVVVWLCSDEASFVTGNAYPVDGGYMAL